MLFLGMFFADGTFAHIETYDDNEHFPPAGSFTHYLDHSLFSLGENPTVFGTCLDCEGIPDHFNDIIQYDILGPDGEWKKIGSLRQGRRGQAVIAAPSSFCDLLS